MTSVCFKFNSNDVGLTFYETYSDVFVDKILDSAPDLVKYWVKHGNQISSINGKQIFNIEGITEILSSINNDTVLIGFYNLPKYDEYIKNKGQVLAEVIPEHDVAKVIPGYDVEKYTIFFVKKDADIVCLIDIYIVYIEYIIYHAYISH